MKEEHKLKPEKDMILENPVRCARITITDTWITDSMNEVLNSDKWVKYMRETGGSKDEILHYQLNQIDAIGTCRGLVQGCLFHHDITGEEFNAIARAFDDLARKYKQDMEHEYAAD